MPFSLLSLHCLSCCTENIGTTRRWPPGTTITLCTHAPMSACVCAPPFWYADEPVLLQMLIALRSARNSTHCAWLLQQFSLGPFSLNPSFYPFCYNTFIHLPWEHPLPPCPWVVMLFFPAPLIMKHLQGFLFSLDPAPHCCIQWSSSFALCDLPAAFDVAQHFLLLEPRPLLPHSLLFLRAQSSVLRPLLSVLVLPPTGVSVSLVDLILCLLVTPAFSLAGLLSWTPAVYVHRPTPLFHLYI